MAPTHTAAAEYSTTDPEHYREMSAAELTERVERTLATAEWAEANGHERLHELSLARLAAMDEIEVRA